MKGLFCLFTILTLSACAPLSPHPSAWGDAGEVAGRVLLCPLTLCTSELMFAMEHDRKEKERAYQAWYWSLSPADRDREDRREAARLQALGFALSGGGPFPQRAPIVPAESQPGPLPLRCSSLTSGPAVYTNCY